VCSSDLMGLPDPQHCPGDLRKEMAPSDSCPFSEFLLAVFFSFQPKPFAKS
jgi:hypothetical protein